MEDAFLAIETSQFLLILFYVFPFVLLIALKAEYFLIESYAKFDII